MPRRAAPPKKKIAADPVYGSVLVQQLINKIMLDGKKSTAEKIVYDALSFIAVSYTHLTLPTNREV